jgi:hypothetical protein
MSSPVIQNNQHLHQPTFIKKQSGERSKLVVINPQFNLQQTPNFQGCLKINRTKELISICVNVDIPWDLRR